MLGAVDRVKKGELTFEEFVWQCARDGHALVSMRGEPMDAPIPLSFEYDDAEYYQKEIEQWSAELAMVSKFSESEWDEYLEKRHAKDLEDYKHFRESCLAADANCRGMLEKVQAWTPPNGEITEFRKMLIEHLEKPMKVKISPGPNRLTKEGVLEEINGLIKDAKKWLEMGSRHNKESSEWIQALEDSVPRPKHLRAEDQ